MPTAPNNPPSSDRPARVLRGAGSEDSTSAAEIALIAAFETLPIEFTVFHSVKWYAKSRGTVGEADFLIAHPQLGVLVLEVKGGVISVRRENAQQVWYSTDKSGVDHEIKDPCVQADRNRRALQDWLDQDPRTKGIRFALFPAVALPDSQVSQDIRPDCPSNIFLDIRHSNSIEVRLKEIYAYWSPRADAKNQHMGGERAIKALIELLIPTRQLQPRVAEIFEQERRKIDELTQNQFRILRQLKHHKRAAIVGGAGSGKTMLAMEKAVQLAEADFRVLFLCFNRHLAEWIGSRLNSPQIFVATYHSFVARAINWAKLPSFNVANTEEFTAKAPELLLDAINVIRAPNSGLHDKLFDAIIVDEAQDFADTWWIALSDWLADSEEGVFYVFFDDNQCLYSQLGNVPTLGNPFILDENCRNTKHIHAALLPYVHQTEEIICVGPEGRPIEHISVEDQSSVRRELQRVLHRLVNDDGIASTDIVVLTPSSEKRSQWKDGDRLGNFTLTWDLAAEKPNLIRVCTIYRFKGLESAVVILTELDQRREEISDQLIYVGLSRARHHAVVIGQMPKPGIFTHDAE